MQTTLDLPDSLLRQVEQRASREGRQVSDVAADLLRIGLEDGGRGLASSPDARPVIEVDVATGFPVIVSPPGSPVHTMSAERLLKLEHDTFEESDLERAGIPL